VNSGVASFLIPKTVQNGIRGCFISHPQKFSYIRCWNSPFNAQGSRLIIVVVQGTGENICSSSVEELRKKERQDETQFTTKIGGKTSLVPSYFVL
jgi:hypothetical protein